MQEQIVGDSIWHKGYLLSGADKVPWGSALASKSIRFAESVMLEVMMELAFDTMMSSEQAERPFWGIFGEYTMEVFFGVMTATVLLSKYVQIKYLKALELGETLPRHIRYSMSFLQGMMLLSTVGVVTSGLLM